jgi:hypothetical protein
MISEFLTLINKKDVGKSFIGKDQIISYDLHSKIDPVLENTQADTRYVVFFA